MDGPTTQQHGWPEFRTTEEEATVAVDVTATKLTHNDPDALERLLVNNGAVDVFVSLQPTVALNTGTRLAANGGTLIYQRFYDHDLTGRALYAIADGAVADVYTMTVRRYRG